MTQGLLELHPRPAARRGARGGRAAVPGLFRDGPAEYWQEFYLLGEAEAVAERIRGQDRGARRRGAPHPQPARLGAGETSRGSRATSCRWCRTDRAAAVAGDRLPPAGTLDEALDALRGEPARWLAGGTDVYPAHGSGAGRATTSWTSPRSPGLRAIARDGGGWRIPALDDVDGHRRAPTSAAVRRAAGGRADDRRACRSRTRARSRERLQRLARRGRPAEPHRARCARRTGVGDRRRGGAGGGVHDRQPADVRRPTSW